MILPFSEHCPWTEPNGQRPKTDFQPKICQGIKIHTFRDGQRWKQGAKIHFYLRNPRNGGVAFTPPFNVVDQWMSNEAEGIWPKKMLSEFTQKHLEEHFTPLVHGVENYKIRVDYNGAQSPCVLFNLEIEELHVVCCNFNLVTHEIKHFAPSNVYSLKVIAENDGLSEVGFLRWFANSAKDKKEKESTGQIIHWTPFRYVADVDAQITDSIFANQY